MGKNYDEGQVEEIKARNDIVDTISKYIHLKKSGQNYVGLCPFHKEKTPSFNISEEKQFYHCFGCGETGDVISFIMKIENLDFVDAITLLGERVGIRVEESSTSKQEKEEINRKNMIVQINREAALFYHHNILKNSSPGLQYLINRGLTLNTIKRFGLGYAGDHWEGLTKYLESKGFDRELVFQAGLISKRKETEGYYDRFRNRVIFPIINTKGKVIGFGGRSIDDSMPKYLNTPETLVFNKGNNLFGINLAKKELGTGKQVIVVEGYMDVISLFQNDIKNVVATLGTALTKSQGDLLRRYADEVLIAYDADLAGQAATLRGLDILSEAGCQVKVIHLSEAKDPDELVMKKGKEGFLKEIEQALPLIDYKIFLAKKENDLSTTEGKIQFVKSITSVLKSIKSPVVVDAYIKKISIESQISMNAIKSEIYGNNKIDIGEMTGSTFGKYRSKNDRHTNKYTIQPVNATLKYGFLEAERCLLKLIMKNIEYYKHMKDMIHVENFSDKIHQKIARIIYSLYEEKNHIDKDIIFSQLEMNEVSVFKEIIDSVVPEENQQKAISDYVKTIKKYKLETEKKELEAELKALENVQNKSTGQIVRIRELCIHYEKLMRELKNL